ncbi:MAG: aminotransferase class I/II-fold pyridoxal phosphate-dependent enzyme, partial [Desulfuromonadales bacterium]|nr:aminotransferase class I/II-fold pyridoxal phosphate-dependent enzyme [Desulfuromonadales bacterium]
VDINEYQQKRDLLYNHLTSLGFTLTKPDGAFYLFPRSPLPDDIAFVNLAQEEKILLVPGTGFGAPGYFRIAYCIDIDIIRRSFAACERLAKRCGL